MREDEDKAKRAAKFLADIAGSQPGVQAAPRRRPSSYLSRYFNSETGEYDIELGDGA